MKEKGRQKLQQVTLIQENSIEVRALIQEYRVEVKARGTYSLELPLVFIDCSWMRAAQYMSQPHRATWSRDLCEEACAEGRAEAEGNAPPHPPPYSSRSGTRGNEGGGEVEGRI